MMESLDYESPRLEVLTLAIQGFLCESNRSNSEDYDMLNPGDWQED